MKKCFFLIILLSLLKKKICSIFCDENNFENYECGWFGHEICELNKKACNSKHCKDCLNCIGGTFCKNCKSGYVLDIDKKTCLLEQKVNPDNKESEGDDIICHPYCQNCNNPPTSESMNCLSCQDNLYKIYRTDNCYDESLLDKGYYLKDNFLYPCNENCLTCSGGKNGPSNNCISCDNVNKNLYLLEDIKNCENRNFPGYYLHEDNKILKKCYERCKVCIGPYEIDSNTNIENHNCIECANNYYKLPNGSYPNNCYDNVTINSWKKIEETILNISNISSSMMMNEITSKIMEETIKENEYTTNNITSIYNEVETTSSKFKTSYIDIGTTINSEKTNAYKLLTTSYNEETIYHPVKTNSDNIESTFNIIGTTINDEETTNNNVIVTSLKYEEETTYKIEANSNNFKTTINDIESTTFNNFLTTNENSKITNYKTEEISNNTEETIYNGISTDNIMKDVSTHNEDETTQNKVQTSDLKVETNSTSYLINLNSVLIESTSDFLE